jgi:hypothetical protein
MSQNEYLYLELTSAEVEELHNFLDELVPQVINSGQDVPNELIFAARKVSELYEDNCVKYTLTPECEAYMKVYGETPAGDLERWELFRENYGSLVELGFVT